MTLTKAYTLRRLIEKASASLPDEDALDAVELFPVWVVGADYTVDARVRYGDKLYRCEQAHTSQADWTPDKTPALWTEVAKPGEIPVWKQPTGAQDAYMSGDRVWFPDKGDSIWESEIDFNAYQPGVYGWREIE